MPATALAALDGIDALVAGHTHLVFPGPDHDHADGVDPVRGTLCGKPAVMPGFWGSHLGVIDLALRETPDGWTVADRAARVEQSRAAPPAALPAPVVRTLADAATRMSRPLARTARPIHTHLALLGHDPASQLLARAQAWHVRRSLRGRAAALPVAAALLVAWVRWERRYSARGGEPMVDMGLFRTRSFANGSLLIALYFVGMTSVWVLIALYMQEGMGHTALAAGFIGLPSALASAITAPLAGRKVVQVGRPMVLWGIGLVLTGILLSIGVVVLRESVGLSEWFLLGTMVFVGVGQGLVVSPNQTLTLADVPVRYAGAAGGVLQTGQRVGTSIGIAAITGVAFSVLARTDWNMAVAVGFGLIAVIVVLAGLVGVRDQRQARAERG